MRDAAVMLIIKGGLILGASRRNNPGKWGLPGGKTEPKEDPPAAAIKECFEETGIQVDTITHIFTRVEAKESPEGEDFHTYCYYANKWSGEPSSKEDGIVIKWLTESELTDSNSGAFADYNIATLTAFKKQFPKVYIHLEGA